jgi:hypothetical protein
MIKFRKSKQYLLNKRLNEFSVESLSVISNTHSSYLLRLNVFKTEGFHFDEDFVVLIYITYSAHVP